MSMTHVVPSILNFNLSFCLNKSHISLNTALNDNLVHCIVVRCAFMDKKCLYIQCHKNVVFGVIMNLYCYVSQNNAFNNVFFWNIILVYNIKQNFAHSALLKSGNKLVTRITKVWHLSNAVFIFVWHVLF